MRTNIACLAGVLICCITAASADFSPQQNEFNRRLNAVMQQSSERLQEDVHDAQISKDPQKRRVLLGQLLARLNRVADSPADRAVQIRSIERVANLKAIEAVPFLIQNLQLRVSEGQLERQDMPDVTNLYPAIGALITIGRPALPYLADAMAEPKKDALFRENAYYTFARILVPKSNAEIVLALKSQSIRYAQKARRIRVLIERIDRGSSTDLLLLPRAEEIGAVPEVLGEVQAYEAMLALESTQDVVHESEIEIAMLSLGKTQFSPAIPVLSEKLDFSPRVANRGVDGKAPPPAALALLYFGDKALPAVADKVSDPWRQELFVGNGIRVILSNFKDIPAAARWLEHVAEDYDEKSVALMNLAPR